MKRYKENARENVVIIGGGAFALSHGTILKRFGAYITTYLTRPKGRYGAELVGRVIDPQSRMSLKEVLGDRSNFWILPMSIDWMLWPEAAWIASGPILAPPIRAMYLERARDFARRLCERFKIPVPKATVARNRLEAEAILYKSRIAWVLKNPLCSPSSPVHTIVCKSPEETAAWLPHIDFAEGVFMQEYVGNIELGHIVLVSAGEIYSLVTNQEYKFAITGDMGPLAEVPLGGMVEADPHDQYGLARNLIHPLLPWLRQVNYHGPIQVTAGYTRGQWKVLEYNVRLGVTSGPLILDMLENPLDTLWNCACNKPLDPVFKPKTKWGCSVSLVGYGFPYSNVNPPRFPIQIKGTPESNIWWNEVTLEKNNLWVIGQRIADVCKVGDNLEEVINSVYRTLSNIHVSGAYFRTDIGKIRWPPTSVIKE